MNQHKSLKTLAFLLLTGLSFQNSNLALAGDSVIRSPFGVTPVYSAPASPDNHKYSCPAPAKPIQHLDFYRFYENKTSSKINKKLYKEYKAAYGPLLAYERQIVRQSNAYITGKSPNPAIAACTLHWLNSWAEGGALLGDVTTQGEYIRKWALGTIASAYVQIKTEPSLDKTEKKRVEKWIEKLAYEVVVDYTRRPELRSRRNNHLYWAAWAVGISSVATQNHNLFDWSMEKARFGIDQIEEDGTLPLETYRQTLALQYHMFALIPLVYLSELGMRNGVNLYDENDARIHRLIKRILASAEDPSYIEKKSGSTQNMQKILTNAQLVWLAPYSARFPENETKRIRRLQKKFDSPDLPRTGGDSELLFPPTP